MTTTDDMTTLVSNSTNNTGSSQGNYDYWSFVQQYWREMTNVYEVTSFTILTDLKRGSLEYRNTNLVCVV
jgi:hypothetical protein